MRQALASRARGADAGELTREAGGGRHGAWRGARTWRVSLSHFLQHRINCNDLYEYSIIMSLVIREIVSSYGCKKK